MMRTPIVVRRAAVALATALSLAVSPALPLFAGQAAAPKAQPSPSAAPAKAPPPTAAAAAAPKAAASPKAPTAPDGGWPRAYSTPSGGKILVYQPQVASWADQRRMVAFSAVAWEAKGATKPALGSIKIEANTKVSTAERLVNFSDFQITESNFPTVAREQVREVVAEIDGGIPDAGAPARPGPRAGQRGPQPDHPEERGRGQGGPADHPLQPDARHPRQPGR